MNKLESKPISPGKAISFTADIVAFARTFSDIPLCRDIFEIAETIAGPLNPKEKNRVNERPHLVPFMEARYRLTDEELETRGYNQVLELASGLSPRGFIACADPHVEYVELDLPDEMSLKRKVVDELHRRQGTARYSNHHPEQGSVTYANDMRATDLYFSREPVFIITEGLLRYLNWKDKEKLAKNVRRIMESHRGSIWMTPDIHILSEVESSPEMRAHYERTNKEWGFDFKPNLFRDFDHAREFFRGFGFVVQERSIADMADRLVTPKRLNMSDEAVHKALGKRKAFVMSL